MIELLAVATNLFRGVRSSRPVRREATAPNLSPFSRPTAWGVVAVLSCLGIHCRGVEPSGQLPTKHPQGVVFVVVDTLRRDYVGVYGSPRGSTPNLDALAARSFVFENAVATSSWTRPSVASMLTSRYPGALGIRELDDVLDGERFPTLPGLLKSSGFQTFGTATNGNTSSEFGFAHGFDRYELPNLKRAYPNDFAIPIAPGVNQKALGLLDGWDGKSPFFLFVHYVDPHDPYLPHPALAPAPVGEGRFDGSRKQLADLDALVGSEQHPSDHERIKDLYAGEVKYVDRYLGALLKTLTLRGLEEKLLIVVTSDHGEGLWDHGIRFHGVDLHEETTAVPLVVHYPGMTSESAKRIPDLVSLTDLAPTILTAFDIPVPRDFQGRDLTPLMSGDRHDLRQYVYSQMDYGGRAFDAVRDGSWKLIRRLPSIRDENGEAGTLGHQLFNLASDPDETSDLAGHETAVESRLEAALEQWNDVISEAAPAPREEGSPNLDRSTVESLSALGYLEATTPGPDRKGEESPESERHRRKYLLPSKLEFTGEPPVGSGSIRGFEWKAGLPGLGSDQTGSATLFRTSRHSRWRIDVLVGAHGSETSKRVMIEIQDGATTNFELDESGSYTMEGALPPLNGPDAPLRLELSCQESAWEEGELAEEPCLVVTSVGLY